MIAGDLLDKKESIWDDIGYSCAEVGTFFVVLTTGPIWASQHGVIFGLGNQG